jgi:hypothetical protein
LVVDAGGNEAVVFFGFQKTAIAVRVEVSHEAYQAIDFTYAGR